MGRRWNFNTSKIHFIQKLENYNTYQYIRTLSESATRKASGIVDSTYRRKTVVEIGVEILIIAWIPQNGNFADEVDTCEQTSQICFLRSCDFSTGVGNKNRKYTIPTRKAFTYSILGIDIRYQVGEHGRNFWSFTVTNISQDIVRSIIRWSDSHLLYMAFYSFQSCI